MMTAKYSSMAVAVVLLAAVQPALGGLFDRRNKSAGAASAMLEVLIGANEWTNRHDKSQTPCKVFVKEEEDDEFEYTISFADRNNKIQTYTSTDLKFSSATEMRTTVVSKTGVTLNIRNRLNGSATVKLGNGTTQIIRALVVNVDSVADAKTFTLIQSN